MDERIKGLLVRGREHYQKREFDKADYLLREVIEHSDSYADVFDMLGIIAHSRGDLHAAARYFERAVALNSSYTEALLNLAVTYNDLGRYEAARQIHSKVRKLGNVGPVQIDPFARGKIANMHADLGQAYAEAGIVHEAIEQYLKAVQLCPSFADLRTRLGTLYRDAGDLPRAREQYEAAKNANPKYVPARVLLGVTLFSLGDSLAAVSEWREVLEIDPDNKSAQMYVRMCDTQAQAARVRPSQQPPPH
ncbi:MAG TPA: tetratricopeptide repeat protein [Polyangiaceae bacterium]|jgi:tetratricopeptide (TPR) repeat protein|nr:tetratricopeptide repeat protein [Polyangiaceae bacterium]